MMRLFSLLAAVLAIGTTASAAEARNVLDTHFSNPSLPSNGCFDRVYSRAHLQKHPVQQVTRITVIRSDRPAPKGGVVLDVFALTRQGGDLSYFARASCQPRGDALSCTPEDGAQGGFTVTAAKNGALLLALRPQGLVFDAADGGVWLQGDAGDDREFLIPNVAPEACY